MAYNPNDLEQDYIQHLLQVQMYQYLKAENCSVLMPHLFLPVHAAMLTRLMENQYFRQR